MSCIKLVRGFFQLRDFPAMVMDICVLEQYWFWGRREIVQWKLNADSMKGFVSYQLPKSCDDEWDAVIAEKYTNICDNFREALWGEIAR